MSKRPNTRTTKSECCLQILFQLSSTQSYHRRSNNRFVIFQRNLTSFERFQFQRFLYCTTICFFFCFFHFHLDNLGSFRSSSSKHSQRFERRGDKQASPRSVVEGSSSPRKSRNHLLAGPSSPSILQGHVSGIPRPEYYASVRDN